MQAAAQNKAVSTTISPVFGKSPNMADAAEMSASVDKQGVNGSAPGVDDTATSVSTEMNDTLDSDSFYYDPMPLLRYSRIGGSSIPVTPSESDVNAPQGEHVSCTCSVMAKVMLDPSTISTNPEGNTAALSDHLDQDDDLHSLLRSDIWKQPQHIMALGFEDGHISLVSVYNGTSLVSEEKITIREGRSDNALPVVDITFDSTGTVLTAIDSQGAVATWEMKYSVTLQQQQEQQLPQDQESTTPTATASSSTTIQDSNGNGNMFSSLMSALTGMPPSPNEGTESQPQPDGNRPSLSLTPRLTASVVHVSRITYPSSWSSPTCLAADPANRKKREKSFITGFQDGRLVLTRRGGLFQRRNDTVVYHGTPDSSSQAENYRGIECITWRGSFVAWADASGIKLLDVETLTRIAHVDRPSGARPTRYPSISSLRPTLIFETSHTLLVGWGDCLMGIEVKETFAPGTDTKRRSVECSMAWELDCICCGVVPLDADNVLVLGLVPIEDGQDDDVAKEHNNDLEVQILSRKDGAVMYCDSLPILKSNVESPTAGVLAEPASSYRLLSSFALPRMDDSLELEEMKYISNEMGEDFDMTSLFPAATGDYAKPVFCDSHLQWNAKSIYFDEEELNNFSVGYDDTASVDSDDYGFILRPLKDADIKEVEGSAATVSPPAMVIVCPSGIILSQTSTVDDAVAHALSRNRNSLALSRGLRHKRQLRRYEIGDLVDHYLEAVLRLRPQVEIESENSPSKADRSLSLRRMELAVKSMPYLLGDRIDQWGKWVKKLESIPGTLFLLREHLPVRDPVLPQKLYQSILQKMLLETEALVQAANSSETGTEFSNEAVGHFLESLLAWGPTSTLKEYIKLYRFSRENCSSDKSIQRDLRTAEIALQRRFLQTCAGYLSFPINEQKDELLTATPPRYEANKDDSKDSLFLVSIMLRIVAPRAPLVAVPGELEDADTGAAGVANEITTNSLLSLESMARLRMMQNRHDLALKCFLTIGLYHSTQSIEKIELFAIDVVNGVSVANSVSAPVIAGTSSKYDYVLGLIEHHHLHRLLLDEKLTGNASAPLIALIRLVGLDLMGRFLIEHCVSPEVSSLEASSELSKENESKDLIQKETLPMDLVAKQLDSSPALLHWYLHLVFTKKPELYVRFPNNYIPPKAVTDLHRKHLELFVEFAGDNKDSAKAFFGIEPYKAEARTTPLLSFLKAALPIGGLSPVEARRLLEIQRNQDSDEEDEEGDLIVASTSNIFSLELAYTIEHYSEETEAEAIGILDLYLEGVKSLMLAVSYAQRQRKHSSLLWDKLISYCLGNKSRDTGDDGTLFGALLEASALCGADVARLVARIPPGMIVEGLRPRLVAAVADSRLKLDIHEAAAAAVKEEKLSLLREVAHRSRRGTRFDAPAAVAKKSIRIREGESKNKTSEQRQARPPGTKVRRDRYSLAYSIPIR